MSSKNGSKYKFEGGFFSYLLTHKCPRMYILCPKQYFTSPRLHAYCLPVILSTRGVKLIFTRGHISLMVAFKGPNVILGLYKCNYSLTRGKELSTTTG